MISQERIDQLMKLDIRIILDDFKIPRTDRHCRCPNPSHNDQRPSCIISYPDYNKYDHMSVYCFVEGERWDPINLYMLLKGYNRKSDFIKTIYEMEKRYLGDVNREEISSRRKIITHDTDNKDRFTSIEEEQQFISDILDNKIERFKVFEWKWDLDTAKYTSNTINEYLYSRCLDANSVYKIIIRNGIRLFHQYDEKYNSNFILYLIKNELGHYFIIRKRIDGYLRRNLGKNIKKLKGNIGKPTPVWLFPGNNEYKKMIIITEGFEDAFTASHINSKAIVVSLNSTNLVRSFISSFDSILSNYMDYSILLALDRDNAGKLASEKLKTYFLDKGFIIGKSLFTYKFYNSDVNDLNEDWIKFKNSLKNV